MCFITYIERRGYGPNAELQHGSLTIYNTDTWNDATVKYENYSRMVDENFRLVPGTFSNMDCCRAILDPWPSTLEQFLTFGPRPVNYPMNKSSMDQDKVNSRTLN